MHSQEGDREVEAWVCDEERVLQDCGEDQVTITNTVENEFEGSELESVTKFPTYSYLRRCPTL